MVGFILIMNVLTVVHTTLQISKKTSNSDIQAKSQFRSTRALSADAILWPKAQESIKKIKIAMSSISKSTCIKFFKRSEKRKRNYVIFRNRTRDGQPICSSDVELRGYPQDIILTPGWCDGKGPDYAWSAAHEIMHTLGFRHEFQRYDRENYITFHPENLNRTLVGPTALRVNFATRPDDMTRGVPFNFKSIMHYKMSSWQNVDRKPVFTEKKPRDPGVVPPLGQFSDMGQTCYFSTGDRRLINIFYQHECGLKFVPRYTKDFRIPGTVCKDKNKGKGGKPKPGINIAQVHQTFGIA